MTGGTWTGTGGRQTLSGLMGAVVLLMVLAMLYGYAQSRIRQQQEKTSADSLSEVARILELRVTEERQAIYSQLRQIARERDEARRMRVARMAGIPVDWSDIFDRVDRLSPQEQETIRQTIAREFRLPVKMSLTEMRQVMHKGRSALPLQLMPHVVE